MLVPFEELQKVDSFHVIKVFGFRSLLLNHLALPSFYNLVPKLCDPLIIVVKQIRDVRILLFINSVLVFLILKHHDQRVYLVFVRDHFYQVLFVQVYILLQSEFQGERILVVFSLLLKVSNV